MNVPILQGCPLTRAWLRPASQLGRYDGVSELARGGMGAILTAHDPDLNRLSITVGEVRTSPDLRVATAFVLPLGGEGQEDAIELLARNRGELRRAIGRKLTLKFTPDLRFRLDDTFDRMDETRRMLEQDAVRRDLDG